MEQTSNNKTLDSLDGALDLILSKIGSSAGYPDEELAAMGNVLEKAGLSFVLHVISGNKTAIKQQRIHPDHVSFFSNKAFSFSREELSRYKIVKEPVFASAGDRPMNSVVAPVIFNDSLIAFFEFFSFDLKEKHAGFFKKITHRLAPRIVSLFLLGGLNNDKYQDLFHNAVDAIAIIDKNGYITLANPAALKLFGYEEEALEECHFSRFIHPDDCAQILRIFHDLVLGKKKIRFTGETRIVDNFNNIKYFNYAVTGIRRDGKITGFEVIGRDVTENKKLIEDIRQAKDHYESIINTIKEGIVVIDKNQTITSCNKAFISRVGLPFDKIRGQRCDKMLVRYDGGVLENRCGRKGCFRGCGIKKVFSERKAFIYTETNHDKTGLIRHHQISVFPTENRQGEIYQVAMSIRDITNRKENERTLIKLNEFNRRILDNAPVSIIVLDKKGFIVTINNLAAVIINEPVKKIIGSKLIEDSSIKKFDDLVWSYKELLRKGKSFYYNNMPYRHASGRQRYLNIVAVPLLDKNKKVDGAISMALDNTETVLAKQKLENMNKDLEKKVKLRTQELNIANHTIKTALESKSKFMADASHEIRTPLTIIKGNLDLAIWGAKTESGEIPEIFLMIDKEIKFITNILSDLTMLTNIDSNTERLNLGRVNLGELIEGVGASLRAVAREKEVALKYPTKYSRRNGANWSYSARWEKLEITGDREKLEKLLLNLMRNAIKYSKKQGYVKVWAESDKKGVRVIVEDNGIGIPKSDLPHIFERFFRVNRVRSRSEGGTGLGLAICKWITETHGGTICAESVLHQGSKFTVFLPFQAARGANKEVLNQPWFLREKPHITA